MPVTIGSKLGSHEITSMLGRGGMGEVYRARDTKLKRDVAIKILPEEFSNDADRMGRFQREAEALAALNHPNIAAIYDLQEESQTRFLVLELVEGDTLADRLRQRGSIPVDQTIKIAVQICDALEAAHNKVIVHRDLKPANVKITPDGKVKLLDFGLARVFGETAAMDLSNSPTLVSRSTPGVILGTAAYMSPEQARGEDVDRRGDIWAFGCVLYEMLTGRTPFAGKTIADLLGAIIHKDIDWTGLPPGTPPRVRDVLRRCLQKDLTRRLHDIADARIELEDAKDESSVGAVGEAQVRQRAAITNNRAFGFVVLLLIAAIVGMAIPALRYYRQPDPPEIRVEVNTPSTIDPMSFAISPDGRLLVFLGSNENKSQLWVRPLDSLTAKPLAGTDEATYPFWSPDSASLGFFADGKLKRIDIAGGAPQVLANANIGRGGAWGRDGTILFTFSTGGPISKVPATGGEPMAVTRLETGQAGHKFPQFLPDGRHFIYFVQGSPTVQGVYAGSLDGASPKRIVSADAAAVVSPLGILLFPRLTTLFAQSFDFKRQELSGNPFPVAEPAAFDTVTNAPGFSASPSTLAYRTGLAGASRQLTWLDRSGKTVGLIGPADTTGLTHVELSPDGRRIAVQRTVDGNMDVWLIDALRGVPTRFTFEAATDGWSVWSHDGSHLVFSSNRKGQFNLYSKLSSGSGTDELLLESDEAKGPTDCSSDGGFLLFRSAGLQTGWDLWVQPTAGDKKPYPFLKTPFDERDGQFSPDGKWIAYQSNESGRFEIYVQPFPGPGGKFQISTNGGAQVRWNKNGKEIFYVSLDSKLMAVQVKSSPDGQSLETETAEALFPIRIAGGPVPGPNKQQYAVSPDGQRFLVNLAAEEGSTSPITLIYNWHPKASK